MDVNSKSGVAGSKAGRTRSEHVAASIRQRIIKGKLPAGAQLPTWSEMERDFGVGRATLMRAMGRLRRDGFVRADSTRGTFVSGRLPHLCRYALAFPHEPDSPGWNRLWWTLARHAARWSARGELHVEPFYGVRGEIGNAAHDRLVADVRAERLAGVIFAGHMPEISKIVQDWPGLPKVCIGTDRGGSIPTVYVDRDALYRRAAEYLARRGVRRVAVLGTHAQDGGRIDAAFGPQGIAPPEPWRFAVHIETRQTAQYIVRLLLNQPADQRPDGLLIVDDNLTAPALAGVAGVGGDAAAQLTVVTHANLPCDEPSVWPVARLGFVAEDLLATAMKLIDAQRRRQRVAPNTLLPAVFESELVPRSSR